MVGSVEKERKKRVCGEAGTLWVCRNLWRNGLRLKVADHKLSSGFFSPL